MEEIRNKKYTQINEAERELIERLLRNNTPKKQIARMLNRSITTIRKEIKRGSVEQRKEIKTTKKDANIPIYQTELVYFADVGQRTYNENRSHCGRKCKIIEWRKIMSDKINVDTRKLHTDLVIIQDCLDQSTIDRRNIQNDYQDLIKEWKGPAADSFNTKFENSDSKVKSMYEDLQKKVDSLLDVCNTFETCEKNVIALIG